ncbi:hypothetical protein CEE45_03090 [Candidatus Heimdallarchaeota archaeon B3_Heim]|nr:MAG: hypothetical protein CEE45_03090 [Candidatus Heimdallarchaeota archaeon B3_Heim]
MDVITNHVFGKLDFFEKLNYSHYWKSKYLITRSQIETLIPILSVMFIGFTFIQIMTDLIRIEYLILEYLFFFVCLRLFFLFIHQDFKNYMIKAEIIGYFVLHELLIILETSKSLKEATKFIITGKYLIFSDIFSESLIRSHFGEQLNDALRSQINSQISGELRRIFLNVIDTWETGIEVAQLSTNMILNHLSEYITEETDKVDTWGSLFSGLIFLSPPVILCFLLLSGQISYIIGIFLIATVFFGSFIFRPDKHLSIFTSHSLILPFTDNKTIEFLMIHAENLSSGVSYTKSLNKALNIYITNSTADLTSSMKDSLIPFRLGIERTSFTELEILRKFFSSRTIQILTLIEKFSYVNTKLAGSKLMMITEEMSKTGNLLRTGNARVKATSFQTTIIQTFSLISLGFIAGASPFFQLISYSVGRFDLKNRIVTNFDPIFISLGFLMSILPIYFNFSSKYKIKSTQGVIFRISRFMLFLIVFILAREILTVSF